MSCLQEAATAIRAAEPRIRSDNGIFAELDESGLLSVLGLNRHVGKLGENEDNIYIMRNVVVGFHFLGLTFLINILLPRYDTLKDLKTWLFYNTTISATRVGDAGQVKLPVEFRRDCVSLADNCHVQLDRGFC